MQRRIQDIYRLETLPAFLVHPRLNSRCRITMAIGIGTRIALDSLPTTPSMRVRTVLASTVRFVASMQTIPIGRLDSISRRRLDTRLRVLAGHRTSCKDAKRPCRASQSHERHEMTRPRKQACEVESSITATVSNNTRGHGDEAICPNA